MSEAIGVSLRQQAGLTPVRFEVLGPSVQPRGANIDRAFSMDSTSVQIRLGLTLDNNTDHYSFLPSATVQREAIAGIAARP